MNASSQVLVGVLGIGAASLFGCAGTVIVTPVPASIAKGAKANLDGVLYALPRTVVKVAVPLQRVRSKKGIYADYGDLFFPDAFSSDEYAKEDGKNAFSIGKSAFSTYGEPDLSRLYYVRLTGGGPVDRTASLDYTEQGAVSGVQAGAENYTTDIVLAAVSAAAGITARVARFGTPATQRASGEVQACLKSSSSEDQQVHTFFALGHAEDVFFTYCQLDDRRRIQIRNAVKAETDKTGSALGSALN
jgi:hypothetical protein